MSGLNSDDIIKMVKEAGFYKMQGNKGALYALNQEHISRFAALVVAAEREACAKLCEEQYEYYGYDHIFAAQIRARGNNAT